MSGQKEVTMTDEKLLIGKQTALCYRKGTQSQADHSVNDSIKKPFTVSHNSTQILGRSPIISTLDRIYVPPPDQVKLKQWILLLIKLPSSPLFWVGLGHPHTLQHWHRSKSIIGFLNDKNKDHSHNDAWMTTLSNAKISPHKDSQMFTRKVTVTNSSEMVLNIMFWFSILFEISSTTIWIIAKNITHLLIIYFHISSLLNAKLSNQGPSKSPEKEDITIKPPIFCSFGQIKSLILRLLLIIPLKHFQVFQSILKFT